MPTSVDAAAGETVTFYCITDAIPEPVNFWFINSEPIESKPVYQLLLYSLINTNCNATYFHCLSFCSIVLHIFQ